MGSTWIPNKLRLRDNVCLYMPSSSLSQLRKLSFLAMHFSFGCWAPWGYGVEWGGGEFFGGVADSAGQCAQSDQICMLESVGRNGKEIVLPPFDKINFCSSR